MDEEKKSGIVALIIVLVVFIASGIYVYKSLNQGKYTYQSSVTGEEFRVEQMSPVGYAVLAHIKDQPYLFKLRYDPKSVENITITKDIKNNILNKKSIYITVDPKSSSVPVIGAIEISEIISRKLGIFNKETVGATTEYANNYTAVATCDNVTDEIGVIWLKLGPETRVFSENGCILVQGENEWEIVRAADRLIYQMLTIME